MTFKAILISVAMLCAVPVMAQQRGTVEFGVFGSIARFDQSLTLDRGVGVGGHVGVFLGPRTALEFEGGEMRATRTLGLRDVNVGILSARFVVTPIKRGKLSLFLGAGAGTSTETNLLHSYGVNGVVGAKINFTRSAALRVDGISDWLANNDWKSYKTLHVGISLFRSPN